MSSSKKKQRRKGSVSTAKSSLLPRPIPPKLIVINESKKYDPSKH